MYSDDVYPRQALAQPRMRGRYSDDVLTTRALILARMRCKLIDVDLKFWECVQGITLPNSLKLGSTPKEG